MTKNELRDMMIEALLDRFEFPACSHPDCGVGYCATDRFRAKAKKLAEAAWQAGSLGKVRAEPARRRR